MLMMMVCNVMSYGRPGRRLLTSVRTAAVIALAAVMGLGFLGLLADADETAHHDQLLPGGTNSVVSGNFDASGTTFRVCFSTMDNDFVAFQPPAPGEESWRMKLEDLDGVDLALPDFLRYFAGIEVEIVAAFVLRTFQNSSASSGGPMAAASNVTFTYYSNWVTAAYNARIGSCHVAFGGLIVTSNRRNCDCPLASTPQEATEANVCCLGFTSHHLRDSSAAVVPAEVQDDQSLGLVQHLLEFYDLSAFVFVCVLLLFMFLVSHLVWLAERHSGSKMFSDRYLQGVDDGMWWSITTMTTVGYGDKSPITPMGKLIGFFWMTAGLVVFSVINGSVSAALLSYKATSVRHVAVSSMDQLVYGYRPICTIGGAHQVVLSTKGLEQDVEFTVRATSSECHTLMNSGKVKSVLATRSMLLRDQDEVNPGSRGIADMPLLDTPTGATIGPAMVTISYGLALPKGSPYEGVVQAGMASILADETVYSPLAEHFRMGWTLQNALHMFGLADLQSGSDMFTAINIPAGQSVEDQDTELKQKMFVGCSMVVFLIYCAFRAATCCPGGSPKARRERRLGLFWSKRRNDLLLPTAAPKAHPKFPDDEEALVRGAAAHHRPLPRRTMSLKETSSSPSSPKETVLAAQLRGNPHEIRTLTASLTKMEDEMADIRCMLKTMVSQQQGNSSSSSSIPPARIRSSYCNSVYSNPDSNQHTHWASNDVRVVPSSRSQSCSCDAHQCLHLGPPLGDSASYPQLSPAARASLSAI